MSKLILITKPSKSEIRTLANVLRNSFQNDPLVEKMFKNEIDEDIKRLAFCEVPLRLGLTYGEVYTTSENLEGIVISVPGRNSAYSMWQMIRSGSLAAGLKMGPKLGKKMGEILKPLELDQKNHMKNRDYIYVSMLCVQQDHQGQGYGGKLLRHIIDKSKDQNIPVYLETETEENVNFYEKYGFKVVRKIILPIINQSMWEMIREPETV